MLVKCKLKEVADDNLHVAQQTEFFPKYGRRHSGKRKMLLQVYKIPLSSSMIHFPNEFKSLGKSMWEREGGESGEGFILGKGHGRLVDVKR